MLTAFNLMNFKSYKDARLPLGPLTVLIGANASGKSNAVEGLRLLSSLAQGQKLSGFMSAQKEAERLVRGRIEDLGYLESKSFGFACETDLKKWSLLSITLASRTDGLHIASESITTEDGADLLYTIIAPSKGLSTDVKVAYKNFSKGPNPHITCSDQLPVFTQLDSPASFNNEHKQAQKEIPSVVKKYQKWLSNILFLDPSPRRMREYSFISDKLLLGDGTNISSVLYALWGDEEQGKIEPYLSQRNSILKFIQQLPEQNIETLSFLRTPRREVMIQLEETFGGKHRFYDASLLSDGTLRVLAIAAAMLSAAEGSLVVIEEIDNGVHPSRAQHLLDQIQAIARQRSLRVLLSTHNPALLDALPDSAIPDVVFCYRDPRDGSSRLARLQDIPDYPELVAQGALGHLMTSGILERFVKFHPGTEERKARSLAWLEAMRGGVGNE